MNFRLNLIFFVVVITNLIYLICNLYFFAFTCNLIIVINAAKSVAVSGEL